MEPIDDAVHEALRQIRDTPGDSFMLCGYEGPETTHFVLLGSGPGGAEVLRDLCPDNDIAYGIIRKEFTYDETKGAMGKANVTKFIRVVWRPESIPLKRKMKIGVLDSQIKKLLGSTHSDLEANSKSELTDAAVMALIERITQKADAVTSAQGKAAASFMMGGVAVQARTDASDSKAARAKGDGYLDTTSLVGNNKGADVDFVDADALKQAIASVRNDASPTCWALAGYRDKKSIEFIGAGSGDVSEMLASCRPQTVCYGLVRVVEQIDKTKATKFVLVQWQPDDVPVMLKAVIGTHKGVVAQLFRPYSTEFVVASADDLDHAKLMNRIMELSGTKSMVTDKKPSPKIESYQRKFIGGVTADPPAPVVFSNKEELVQAVKNVRSDDNPITWAVASWSGDIKALTLGLVASGAGGLAEFRDALATARESVAYGILRVTQTIDQTAAVKFIFVTYQGPDITPVLKAKISTLRGGVLTIFHPFHVEMFVDSVDEVSEEALSAKLGGMDRM